MRCQRGQATIDYVAIVAVLAILLGATATVASGGAPGIANAVLGQVRRALCIVTGGACAAERRDPCTVEIERDARHVAVTILVVRLAGDRYVMRERMSDGTVRVTLAHRGGAGIELGVGGRGKAKLEDGEIGVDDEARVAAEGVLGYGEVYVARDDHEADEILHDISHRIPLIGGGGRHPRERFVEGGLHGLARLGIGSSAAGAALERHSERILGARRDERTGTVTITLNAGAAGGAMLSSLLAPSGASSGDLTFAVTLDRGHHPIELSFMASGSLSAGATVATGIEQRIRVHHLNVMRSDLRGRRWDLGARLDLRDPDLAAAWAAFRHHPTDTEAIRGLATALRTRAQLDTRTYAVSTEYDGGAVGAGFGGRFGGELDHTIDRTRLLTAATRPPGGLWEQRADCVPS